MPNPPYISGVDDFKYLWLGTERLGFFGIGPGRTYPITMRRRPYTHSMAASSIRFEQMGADIAAYGPSPRDDY